MIVTIPEFARAQTLYKHLKMMYGKRYYKIYSAIQAECDEYTREYLESRLKDEIGAAWFKAIQKYH